MSKKRKRIISAIAIFLALLMLGSVLFSVIGALSAEAVNQSQINALKEERQKITDEKDEISGQIEELEAKQATYLERKAALDHQNELAKQEIEVINEQIDIYNKVIENREKDLEQAKEKEQTQMENFRTRMRVMEENGTLSYIAYLFQATSFSDLLTRIDQITEVVKHDSQLEADYIAAREQAEELKASYEEAQVEIEQTKSELEAKKEQLERDTEAAYKMIADLEKDIAEYTKAYEENEAAEAEVQAQIDDMIAELQRQEAAAAAAAARNNNAGSGNTSTYTPAPSTASKGTYIWPYPQNNYVSSGFGYRFHPIFKENRFHSGVDIGGTAGQSIVAAASGTVSIATYSSSYGNYVVINHGSGNTTLYAHMDSLNVSAGSSVSQGDVIGYCGSTGWSTGPHLHFEITAGGTRVDPLSYFDSSAYVKGF